MKLSVGILPLPLPRRVEIEARGVGYWIFRGSSGHFDHSTILTSTIPATKLFYLRWGAQGNGKYPEIVSYLNNFTASLHIILKQTGEKIKFRHPGLAGPGACGYSCADRLGMIYLCQLEFVRRGNMERIVVIML